MSLFRRSDERRHSKRSDASWVFMESPDALYMDSPKTNGSTAVRISSNGRSSPISNDLQLSKEYSHEKEPEDKNKGGKMKKCLGENALTIATFVSVVIGICLGLGLRNLRDWTKREAMYLNFPGELFLNMLKCLILPLIMSSLVSAVGSLDTKLTGKIGMRAVVYYLTTTVLAIILGIVLVIAIKPGVSASSAGGDNQRNASKTSPTLTEDTLMDLVRSMFPPNLIEAATTQYATVLVLPEGMNASGNYSNEELRKWTFRKEPKNNSNILGIVVFSIVLGITLAVMKKKGKPLLEVFITLSDAIMIITKAVIWISPIGVLFLISSQIVGMKDLQEVAGQVGMYTATVLVGILVHGFVVLPLIYFILVRKNPLTFIINMSQALATAFATASSSATLPITITCLEEKNKIDPRISRFCLPIGATINMDGTALYEAVAAIFIAQIREVPLSAGSIIAISITATAASVGAAGIPQAGLVTMVMVLNVVGLPSEDVALILVVDWMLDRIRTAINVLGDAIGSGIVAHFSQKELKEFTEDNLDTEITTL